MPTWLIVVIAVVIVGAVLYFQYQARKKKIAEFRAYAAQRGWQYAERDNGVVSRFQGGPFGAGHSRSADHVVRGGHRGRDVVAFEYSYKETHGTGKDRRTETYYYTVAGLTLPAARPTLEVGREGLGRKLLGFVGVRDLQLESEEFNSAFHIRTDDDKFAYDVLHPRMMEWLLADPRARELPFRFEHGDLYSWDRGKTTPARVDGMIEYLCDVVDRVPSFVWK